MHPLAFISAAPVTLRRPRHGAVSPRMSGVNGGIDYSIDLSKLPAALAKQVTYIQQGPDSPTSLIQAAGDIAAASATHPETLPVLVDMLGFNNPVAANIAIDALAKAGADALPPLLTGVAAFNYSVNAYALRTLARIGEPSVADVCLECARKGPIPNVRRAACRALAGLRFTDREQAREAYECLVGLARSEPDWGVRYAAIVALETFQADGVVGDDLLREGLSVVRNAAGLEGGDDSEGLGAVDPTVAARAYVAQEIMSRRAEVLSNV